jgi:MoxR-like ATPase
MLKFGYAQMHHLKEINDLHSIISGLEKQGYIIDEDLATVVFLMLKIQKPILLEGNPGIGKTELANVLARLLGTRLIRLQCYEGLDVHSAVYEWNYQKQLLAIKIQESGHRTEAEKERHIFGEDYLLKRPLLESITERERAPVLLIDEIDRTDEEFEAFLLELLSEFQISIPEMGTVKAAHIPYVILTSNRTRELSDALRRRCLYHWVEYPSLEKELAIVRKRFPDIEQKLATQLVHFIQQLRTMKLQKLPGVAETLDWALSLMALGYQTLDVEAVQRTYGCFLKSNEDIKTVQESDILAQLTH